MLGKSSGFQSAQYRLLEFLLGNKNPAMVAVFGHDPERQRMLRAGICTRRACTTSSCCSWPAAATRSRRLLERDLPQPHTLDQELVAVFTGVYDDPERQWDVYETCEELVDVEDTFQTWRFRHLKTVERIIGLQARHRRLVRRRLPAPGAVADLLPRTVRRPHRDRRRSTQGLP